MQLLVRVYVVIFHLVLANDPLTTHRAYLGNLFSVLDTVYPISPRHSKCLLYILPVDKHLFLN